MPWHSLWVCSSVLLALGLAQAVPSESDHAIPALKGALSIVHKHLPKDITETQIETGFSHFRGCIVSFIDFPNTKSISRASLSV